MLQSLHMKYPLLSVAGVALILLGAGCSSADFSNDLPDSPSEDLQLQTIQEQPQATATTAHTLDLSNRGLTKIPNSVFSQTDLESLNLSGNALEGAPQAEIRHLQKLTSLNLSGNNLTGLPAELGQLAQLQTLDVSNNQLTGLPLELGNLTQLRVLDIRGNTYSAQDLDQIMKKLPNTEVRR
ncbi:hypothetical protein COX00_00140 [Candidatus Uhrbacteria bacterium CG22_combo_CG10-13_8_21_14_all_47_17]|uniref:Leucine-rich repeat domain-containing protein n=1 Tax=Candidatus Uhrbacteria bacterium CG22_combo_CG10-13_8_21_14_all_47_17 TaxID=1975041 RepID=A0A2H0BVL3_9BACT|nr:MAG: hypothetical protein COX00_00140 [Candidatus Uhrbacteria bacterium CG22_combo_CG10-13_8_21_14_all_47_17]